MIVPSSGSNAALSTGGVPLSCLLGDKLVPEKLFVCTSLGKHVRAQPLCIAGKTKQMGCR